MIVLLGYLALASGTVFVSDGSKRVEVAEHLVDDGRFNIDPTDHSPIGVDGKQYTQYAIGYSLVTVPFYLTGKLLASIAPPLAPYVIEFSESLVNLLATVLTLILLAVFAGELGFGPRTTVAMGLLYAFGTMAWEQSKNSFEHPLIGLYFTALFLCLHRFACERRLRLLVFAGIALGLAVLTRYTSVLASGGVVVLLACIAMRSESRRRLQDAVLWIGIVAATVVPFLAFDCWFNYVRFGSVLETGQQQLYGSIVSPATFFPALWGLTISWQYGLFVFNPVLVIGIWGAPRLFARHRALVLAILVVLISHLVFYAMTQKVFWSGGWTWGPRFFVDVLPLMMLLCAPAIDALPRLWRLGGVPAWAATALLVVSVLIQCESVLVNSNRNLAKKASAIAGYSYEAAGVRDSLIYMQAESVWEVSRNLLAGRGPSQLRPAHYDRADAASLIDDTLTYGSFQVWWVYALHLGIARQWIPMYLLATILGLAWSVRALRRRLDALAGLTAVTYSDCPCTSR